MLMVVLLVSGLRMMKLWMRKERIGGQARCWKVKTRSRVVRTVQHHLLLLLWQVMAGCWVSLQQISVTTGGFDHLLSLVLQLLDQAPCLLNTIQEQEKRSLKELASLGH